MKTIDRNTGIFGPRELSEMRDQLDRESRPGETPLDREARAAVILRAKRSESAKDEAGTDTHFKSGTSSA